MVHRCDRPDARRYSPLITDLYQLTMAQAYFLQGLADLEASFYLSFRENPFKGGYTVLAGTSLIEQLIKDCYFSDEDIAYLSSLQAPAGGSLFVASFLKFLSNFKPSCSIRAALEGSLVFPREPVLQIRGSLLECQLLETVLLNLINFQSLVATKAARVVQAASGGTVAEFGLRRAQGVDGGIAASRAAYIGGCNSTSNVEAARRYGIPVAGTHAHSWVMAFVDELEAFRALSFAMPKNCSLLIDTYEVSSGIKNAILVAKEMESRGERLQSVRIDSGDLAYLSKQVRQELDKAGLEYVRIMVSNNLDEHTILSLKSQGAPIDAWGVGTKLSTSYDQAALSGVYKLSAIKEQGRWRPVIKLSEQVYKLSIPGILEARRYYDKQGMFLADMIYDGLETKQSQCIVDPVDATLSLDVSGADHVEELLHDFVLAGELCPAAREDLEVARARLKDSLAHLQAGAQRFLNPQVYACGIEEGLYKRRTEMIKEIRAQRSPSWR